MHGVYSKHIEPNLMKKRGANQPLATIKKQRCGDDEHNTNCTRPPKKYPWILFETSGNKNAYLCCTTSPLHKGYLRCTMLLPDSFSVKKVFNCCYGWLILSNLKDEFALWNPMVSKLIKLPLLESKTKETRFDNAVLSFPGNKTDHLDPNCMVLLFHGICGFDCASTYTSISYCILGENRWNTVIYCNPFRLCAPIILNDSVYVQEPCGWDGGYKLFCINSRKDFEKTLYCQLPRLTRYTGCEYHVEGHLVESCGELFYIVITMEGFYSLAILSVQVFKFDPSVMIWNKVREVGDRVFLLGGSCDYSISSWDATSENRGGFLYYFSSRCLYLYSFADNSVSTCFLTSLWDLPKVIPNLYDPVFYLPDRRFTDGPIFPRNSGGTRRYEIDGRKIKEPPENNMSYRDKKYEEKSLLFCYPEDNIKSITRLLNPVDFLNFRMVSRASRRLTPQSELRKALHLAYASSPLSPWFISSDNRSGIFKFVDSQFGGEYHISIPDSLLDTKIHHLKDGWLLMSKDEKILYLYNPFTRKRFELPELIMDSHGSWSLVFSSSPLSPKCVVAGINGNCGRISVHIFEIGKQIWDRFDFHNYQLSYDHCRVFHHEACYVLGGNGVLGAFKLQDDEQMSWNLVEITKRTHNLSYSQKFILELNGKLLIVLIGEEGKQIRISAQNQSTLSWEEVKDLENHTLYLSRTSSFSTPARACWMKNIIFLPRLHEKKIVYYSMKTGKYHVHGDKEDKVVEFRNTRELLIAGWIEPSWL